MCCTDHTKVCLFLVSAMDAPILDEDTWDKMPWWKKALRGVCAIPGVGLVVGAGYAIAGDTELAADAIQCTFVSTVNIVTAYNDNEPDPHWPSNDN